MSAEDVRKYAAQQGVVEEEAKTRNEWRNRALGSAGSTAAAERSPK